MQRPVSNDKSFYWFDCLALSCFERLALSFFERLALSFFIKRRYVTF